MKTPENFIQYLAAHRDCTEEIMDYARMLSPEDIETGAEPKIARIRRMISLVMLEIHTLRGFVRLVPLADNISYGFMEPEHEIGMWVADSLAHRFPNTEIIIGNNRHTWRSNYSENGIMHTQGPGIMATIDELKKEQGIMPRDQTTTDTQKLWMTYYLSQHCPDRKNLRLFHKNMPEKHMKAAGLRMEQTVSYTPLTSFS